MDSDVQNGDLDKKAMMTQRYADTAGIFEEFFKSTAHGDLTAIYRNRPCYSSILPVEKLTRCAIDAFVYFPSARPAIYHYTGMMIHECVHHWFNKKENVAQTIDTTSAQEATSQLLNYYIRFFTEGNGKGGLEEILQWACELCAELSSKNAGRPAMAQIQQNGEVLAILKSNELIDKLLSLMNMVVTNALNENPDGCMRALFESSRHGQHFSWIWLHIATFLQGTIMTHLLESGAEQFRTYATEINNRKAVQSSGPAVLNIIQTEYEHKFRAISEVFNFLMARRNPELQEAVSQLIVDSLDSKIEKSGEKIEKTSTSNRLGFAFFFKLVTCSLKTLQILVNSNCHLITPFNVVRAIRHVQAADKSLILPALSYTDFMKQILGDVDPTTHGMIFELFIELVYRTDVFDGENLPEFKESNQEIKRDCYPVLDFMINQLVRIAHSSGGFKCPTMHPAIQMYSSGDRLQFLIDSVSANIVKSGSIVRHLHAISIAHDPTKAAEISLRFLMTTRFDDTDSLYVFMSFLSATVPFYPDLMNHMWKEFSGLKLVIESYYTEQPDSVKIHLNLLHNIRQILEWELTEEPTEKVGDTKKPYAFWNLFPGQHVGSLLNSLMGDTNRICWELMESSKWEEAMNIYRFSGKLLEALRMACSPVKMPTNDRKIVMNISEMYKLMSQFAIMLKSTLFLVTKENLNGLVVFEELRSQIVAFLFGPHMLPELSQFSPIFVNFFVTVCMMDSKKLFGERIGESMGNLLDETGLQKLVDNVQLEDGPSVLEGLRSLKMRDNALDMLHTGQLKRRRGNEMNSRSVEENEDAVQRLHTVLDAVRTMCASGDNAIQIACSQQLAEVLVQSVCQDSLMMDMRFDEWDAEAEYIHRHVEVAQRINQSQFSDGILRILADTRVFALCLPIMKSKLAVIINETEKFPDHKTISEVTRQKLHNWFYLASKGGLIPPRFSYICDLEKYSTCHETYLMLLEVWKFFLFRNTTRDTIDIYHKSLRDNAIDEGLPHEKEAMERINMAVFRIIIQNHLPHTVAVFPKLFPVEFEFLRLSVVD
ncbi:hypothetical protein B9Z55_021771 [Caenorhabditis nigoni]|uniref:Integrator complex subunit 5 C-terminal domain-containing protein n=1 Tax=Caenorhabditis nigoni TaxID=1611254 RepID=A0A2G5TTJ2_9PELO|nr:hypothetical protein B9Z55_021771 [Caenorhabditis nigoni]